MQMITTPDIYPLLCILFVLFLEFRKRELKESLRPTVDGVNGGEQKGKERAREMSGDKDVFDLVAQLEAVERVGSVGMEHLGQVAQGKREVGGQLAVAVHTVLHGLVQD